MTTRRVYIQALVDFADKRRKVDPWALADAAESFYRSVKVVGLKDTVLIYDDQPHSGDDTTIYVRAFAAHITRLVYRWGDLNGTRLEEHFGLNMPIREVLSSAGVFKTTGGDLACINVAEVIDTWATN